MIAVNIRYFQREPGILVKTLMSLCASEGVDDVCVIVVDDESPISAASELAEIVNTRFPVKLIQQPNAPPQEEFRSHSNYGRANNHALRATIHNQTSLNHWRELVAGWLEAIRN